MDRIRLCLCVLMAISCWTQLAMAVPVVLDVLDFHSNPSQEIADGIFEPKDTKDMFDSSVPRSRFRRFTAQLVNGAHHYGRNASAQTGSNRRFPRPRPTNVNVASE
ncbi:hypothetical protein BsWGS_09108 [Bradybaena similaris]